MNSPVFLWVAALAFAPYLHEERSFPMPLEPYFNFQVRKFAECFLAVSAAAALAWSLSRADVQSAAFLRFAGLAGFLGLGYLNKRREAGYALFFAAGFFLHSAVPNLVSCLALAAEVSAGVLIFNMILDALRARLLLVPVPVIFAGTPALLVAFWLTAVILFVSLLFFL